MNRPQTGAAFSRLRARLRRVGSSTPNGVRLTASSLIALATGMTLGNVGGNVMPLLLDGFMDRFDLSATVAGLVAAAQLLTTAVFALALSARAARPGRVRLARIGLVAAAAGFACAWIAPTVEVLFVANTLAGAGLGATYAAAAAALSSAPHVDRATTLTVFFSTLATAVLILSIPLARSFVGDTGGFLLLAVCCGIGLLLLGGLPDATSITQQSPPTRLSWMFVAAVALLGISEQGVWSYAEVLGRRNAGLDASSTAAVLGVAAVAALLGVPLAGIVRRACGIRVALACVLMVGAVAKVTVAFSGAAAVFAIACVSWQICYLATLVLMLAAAAQFDPSGRWSAASAGALALGTGTGPAAIGATLDQFGAMGLAIGIVIAVAVAAVPILGLANRVDRGRRARPVAADPEIRTSFGPK